MVVITFETGDSSNLSLLPKRLHPKRILLKRLLPKRLVPKRMFPTRPKVTRRKTSYMPRSMTCALDTVDAESRSVIEIQVCKAHPSLGEVM